MSTCNEIKCLSKPAQVDFLKTSLMMDVPMFLKHANQENSSSSTNHTCTTGNQACMNECRMRYINSNADACMVSCKDKLAFHDASIHWLNNSKKTVHAHSRMCAQ